MPVAFHLPSGTFLCRGRCRRIPTGGRAASLCCVVAVMVGLPSSVPSRWTWPSAGPAGCGRGSENPARGETSGVGFVKGRNSGGRFTPIQTKKPIILQFQ